MNTLAKLKLVSSKRSNAVSPQANRRNKLANRIAEQIALVTAQKEGRIYAPKQLRRVLNEATGERIAVEHSKRVKEWYWKNDAGKYNLAIRYGAKTLTLNGKGANAVEVSTMDELVDVLTTIKAAVIAGELDEAINTASSTLRAGFKQ